MTDLCHEITDIMRREQSFLILNHYRPDGDAIGSQLALTMVLQGLGKTVEAWNDDEVPAKFKFLPGANLITRPPATPKAFDVVITLDTSTWQRVGTAADKIAGKKHFINIDHHVSNEKFAQLNWIVPAAPASGQIVFDLIKRGGFTLTPEIAQCLFAAISTDTGSFMFGNTTASCLRAAAELVETGINVGELSRHVYESYPYARLRMLQMALADLKLTDHKHTAYFWLTNDMFTNSGAKREDTEGLIDFARAIEGVVVALLFEELEEVGKFRVSFRSKNPKVDVNSIARHFGGGGHREAAGARLTGLPKEIETKVLAAVTAALATAGI
ncbi:MAG: bifunctional oligoribonuclease/PAP phosphatase NrnA [Verrucomicrobiota bacterium]|jgi:bifunctional oligoribonuclease and PAP phosphatase NrnA